MIKIGIKPVLPSLREKKRYLVYEVRGDRGFAFREVKKELENTMLRFLGELGYGKAGIMIMDEWNNNRGMIKTNTKSLDQVKTALTLVETVGNQKVMVKTLGVSGMLNKAKNKFIHGGR